MFEGDLRGWLCVFAWLLLLLLLGWWSNYWFFAIAKLDFVRLAIFTWFLLFWLIETTLICLMIWGIWIFFEVAIFESYNCVEFTTVVVQLWVRGCDLCENVLFCSLGRSGEVFRGGSDREGTLVAHDRRRWLMVDVVLRYFVQLKAWHLQLIKLKPGWVLICVWE